MELLSVASARSTWLFDMNDLNPQGKDLGELVEFLKDNYQFAKAPKSPTDLDETKGLSFKQGRFRLQEELYIAVELTVYNDGILANTFSSTENTDRFVSDVLTFTSKEFDLTFKPEMIREKLYVSELVVKLDGSMSIINPKLNEIAAKVSKLFKLKTFPPFELGSFGFWTDSTATVIKPPAFVVERKAGAAFSEHRFYSKAPLQTEEHKEVLRDIEAMMNGA